MTAPLVPTRQQVDRLAHALEREHGRAEHFARIVRQLEDTNVLAERARAVRIAGHLKPLTEENQTLRELLATVAAELEATRAELALRTMRDRRLALVIDLDHVAATHATAEHLLAEAPLDDPHLIAARRDAIA